MRLAKPITAEPAGHDDGVAVQPPFTLQGWQQGALLVLLAVAAFAPVLTAGWVWCDAQNVTENVLLRTWRGVGRVWVAIAGSQPYRPVATTALAVQSWMFAQDATGYHVVGLALHAFNVLLLWKLLRRLAVSAAWLAAALFAVHPAQAQAVAWVSQHGTLLATTLLLVSTLLLVYWLEIVPEEINFEDTIQFLPRRPALTYAGACFGFVGAALADASVALTFPALMLALLWWKKPDPMSRLQRRSLIPFAVLAVATVALAAWNVRSTLFLQFGSAGARAVAMLADLLVPVPALLNRLQTVSTTWGGVFCTATVAVSAAAVVNACRRRPSVPRGAVAGLAVLISVLFAAGLFRGPMLRASDVTVVDGAAAYAAAAPLLAMAAAWVARSSAMVSRRYQTVAGRMLSYAPAAVLPLGLAALTAVAITPRFANVTAFWRVALEKESTRPLALRHLGSAELAAGSTYDAERYYAAARDLNPADTEAVAGLAESMAARFHLHDAAIVYRQGLRNVPRDPRLTVGLAAIENRRGNRIDALALYETALQNEPNSASLHNDIAAVLLADGQPDPAINHLRRAISLDPASVTSRLNLATALFQAGQYAEAAEQLREVLRIDPMNFDAHFNAGVMYASMKQYELAERALRGAVRCREGSYDAWMTLASVLEEQGKGKDADWCRSMAGKLKK